MCTLTHLDRNERNRLSRGGSSSGVTAAITAAANFSLLSLESPRSIVSLTPPMVVVMVVSVAVLMAMVPLRGVKTKRMGHYLLPQWSAKNFLSGGQGDWHLGSTMNLSKVIFYRSCVRMKSSLSIVRYLSLSLPPSRNRLPSSGTRLVEISMVLSEDRRACLARHVCS